MQFKNSFEISASPSDVIAAFSDVPLITSFLPGAQVGPVNEDGGYPGELTVSFGPKRMTFKGTLKNDVDRVELSGVMSGVANADVRGAKMIVRLAYHLQQVEHAQSPTTRVSFVSDAQLTGLLAEFAKTGGTVLVNAILSEFAKRFSTHFSGNRPTAEPIDSSDTKQAEVLSTKLILMGILKQWLCKVKSIFR